MSETRLELTNDELDAAIAERVMGISLTPKPCSSDLNAAWQVVEHLRQQGWLVVVKEMPDGFPFLGPDDMDPQPRIYRRACCSLSWISRQGTENTSRCINLHPFAVGDSVPQAICRCALAAAAMLERWQARKGFLE